MSHPVKRVVVRHLDGLHQILGIWGPLPGHQVPTYAPDVLVRNNRRVYAIQLTQSTDRAYWYDEVAAPFNSAFGGDPA